MRPRVLHWLLKQQMHRPWRRLYNPQLRVLQIPKHLPLVRQKTLPCWHRQVFPCWNLRSRLQSLWQKPLSSLWWRQGASSITWEVCWETWSGSLCILRLSLMLWMLTWLSVQQIPLLQSRRPFFNQYARDAKKTQQERSRRPKLSGFSLPKNYRWKLSGIWDFLEMQKMQRVLLLRWEWPLWKVPSPSHSLLQDLWKLQHLPWMRLGLLTFFTFTMQPC